MFSTIQKLNQSTSALLLFGLLFSLGFCKKAPPPIPVELSKLTCDQKNRTELEGKTIQLEGYLNPGIYWACSPELGCSLKLGSTIAYDIWNRYRDLSVYVGFENGPNSMDRLPENYGPTHLKFRDKTGKELNYKSKVRMTGSLVFYEADNKKIECYMRSPNTIEAIP